MSGNDIDYTKMIEIARKTFHTNKVPPKPIMGQGFIMKTEEFDHWFMYDGKNWQSIGKTKTNASHS